MADFGAPAMSEASLKNCELCFSVSKINELFCYSHSLE